jgi:hypothetical protein
MAHRTLLLLTLAACSISTPEPGAKSVDTETGGTVELVVTNVEDAQIDDTAFNDEGWSAQVVDGIVIYESAGSGSCAPVVNSATLEDGVITLNRTDYSGQACTMDYRPYKQEIARADGEPIANDVDFVLNETAVGQSDNADADASLPAETGDFVITDLESSIETSFASGAYYEVTIEDGGVVYTAGGAGGCPPVIESAEYRGDTIALIGKDWGQGPCEESYVVVKQRIVPTDGTLIAPDTEVVVEQPSAYYN